MPAIPPSGRIFKSGEEAATILVEFAAAVPASIEPVDRVKRLCEACNVEILPRVDLESLGTGNAAPASARSFRSDRRFIEVKSQDERRPIEVAASISAQFGDEVATILPVPFAVPAIAPEPNSAPAEMDRSPDFQSLQAYAGPSPAGLGFSEIGHLPGANGSGVTVIDLEGGWLLGHEALRGIRFNLWAGVSAASSGWIEHGTAVTSLMLAPRSGVGIAGLVPAARGALASIFVGNPPRQLIAQQVDACRKLLGPGDVLLVEVQRPGPATDFEDADDQRGYLPTSFWPDVKESIRDCVAAGITVIEVAGNGGVDLGDPDLQGAFDQTGSTVTALGPGDSGGIMVGAGRPPLGSQRPLERLTFSNFGERLDCQAWGESVVSAGYGDLWGKPGGKTSYTRRFMGTSSAAPLVAAAAAAAQGRHRHKFGRPIPPLYLRQILASFGAPQADGERGRIGPQPDLVEIFRRLDLL